MILASAVTPSRAKSIITSGYTITNKTAAQIAVRLARSKFSLNRRAKSGALMGVVMSGRYRVGDDRDWLQVRGPIALNGEYAARGAVTAGYLSESRPPRRPTGKSTAPATPLRVS